MAVRQVGASHSRVGFREPLIFFIIFSIPFARGDSSITSSVREWYPPTESEESD